MVVIGKLSSWQVITLPHELFNLIFFLCPAGGEAVTQQLGQCLAAGQGRPTT